MVTMRIRRGRSVLGEVLPAAGVSVLIVLWACGLANGPASASEVDNRVDNQVDNHAHTESQPEVIDMTGAETVWIDGVAVEVLELNAPVARGRQEAAKPAEVVETPRHEAGSELPTAHQVAVIREVCGQSWDDVEGIAERVGSYGIGRDEFVKTCVPDLLGIMWAESRFRPAARNLSAIERSFGYFQINLDVHRHVTVGQADDLRWSAAWTLNRIVIYGYPKYRTHAIQCHQGCNAQTGYVDKVKAASGRIGAAI